MILLWLACSGTPEPDPVLDPLKSALDAYDLGRAELDAGRPDAAVLALKDAVEHDPRSPELWLWLGRAHAETGDDLSAIQAADRALGLAPDSLEARYNRACWRARFGDLDGAAQDLSLAAQDARLDPFEVALDPDLEPLRASPAHARVVPQPRLPVELVVSTEPVFLGGEVTVQLDVLHPAGGELILTPPAPGPAALRKVIEDRRVEGALQTTTFRLAYVATAAGELVAGPAQVTSGVFEGASAPASVPLLAPEGHTASASDTPWTQPSRSLSRPGREGDRVVVLAEPGDQIDWAATDVIELELRDRGQPVQIGWSGVLEAGEPVRVLRGRREVQSLTP